MSPEAAAWHFWVVSFSGAHTFRGTAKGVPPIGAERRRRVPDTSRCPDRNLRDESTPAKKSLMYHEGVNVAKGRAKAFSQSLESSGDTSYRTTICATSRAHAADRPTDGRWGKFSTDLSTSNGPHADSWQRCTVTCLALPKMLQRNMKFRSILNDKNIQHRVQYSKKRILKQVNVFLRTPYNQYDANANVMHKNSFWLKKGELFWYALVVKHH